jgi:serine/threonine-protein kinase
MSDFVGTLVNGRYRLEKLVGEGGQGAVYRATDETENRPVAVKVLPIAAKNKEQSARLAREQEAALALAGTNAVAVYDLCEGPQGALCLVMEFLEGEDLEHHLQELEAREDRMGLARLSAITEPLAATLDRAHQAGILHRDLKPGNVFLISESAGGGIRLLDFGLSRMKSATPLTAAGTVLGSPSYIAPEVWKGRTDALDGRADVYSLGVILFRALTGKFPFPGESLQEKFLAATTAKRPSLHALRPDLPKRVDTWVETALAIDPEKRYATAGALYGDLLAAIEYSPTPGVIRPVAQGLVSAWKKAAGAFRRFIAPEERSPLPPEPQPSVAPTLPADVVHTELAAIDEGWDEGADDRKTSPGVGLVTQLLSTTTPLNGDDGTPTLIWKDPKAPPVLPPPPRPTVPRPPIKNDEEKPQAPKAKPVQKSAPKAKPKTKPKTKLKPAQKKSARSAKPRSKKR